MVVGEGNAVTITNLCAEYWDGAGLVDLSDVVICFSYGHLLLTYIIGFFLMFYSLGKRFWTFTKIHCCMTKHVFAFATRHLIPMMMWKKIPMTRLLCRTKYCIWLI
jgi:hypothetical protein